MIVTLEELLKIRLSKLTLKARKELKYSIAYLRAHGNKGFIHQDVLKDIGIEV